MRRPDVEGTGTTDDPWILLAPPGKSEFEACRDLEADPLVPVVQVGATERRCHLRGASMLFGIADERRDATPDTIAAWGRAADKPQGGGYRFKKGLRGRFGNYVPPVLEALDLAEVEHNARNNRMRAI
jgi:hypothetical protein